MRWSTDKCLVVGACWVIGLAVFLFGVALIMNIDESHTSKNLKTCVQAGGSWVVEHGDRVCNLPDGNRK